MRGAGIRGDESGWNPTNVRDGFCAEIISIRHDRLKIADADVAVEKENRVRHLAFSPVDS